MSFLDVWNGVWITHRLALDTYLAAIVLYAISKQQKKAPLSLFRAFNISVGPQAHPFPVVLDVLLTSAAGSYLTFKLTNPITESQAIIAGLGMTGILSSITKNRP